MNIHEYQAKKILQNNGIPIPRGGVAYTPTEAENIAGEISAIGPWVIKAQIHSGARNNGHFIEARAGFAGGIRIVNNRHDVYTNATAMLGATLVTSQTDNHGYTVNKIYIEEFCRVEHTFYLGMSVNRTIPAITLLAADTQDEEITELVNQNSDKILRLPLSLSGPTPEQVSQVAKFLNIRPRTYDNLQNFIGNMFKTFVSSDALMIELNPAAERADGSLIALDAKIALDDNALYRHQENLALKDESENSPRAIKANRYSFVYREYNGNIGCIVNGEGLGLSLLELIEKKHASAACTLNVKSSVDRDKIAAGIKIIVNNPKVEGIIINILGGFLRCDLITDGIIDAAAEVGMNIPLVVRFEGTNRDEARHILEQAKLPLIMAEDAEDAVVKIIKAIEENE